jgi:hypothetical protein
MPTHSDTIRAPEGECPTCDGIATHVGDCPVDPRPECPECPHPLGHHDSMGCVSCGCGVSEPTGGWPDA